MITDAILSVFFAAGRAVLAIIPDWSPPSFVGEISTKAADLGEMAAGFGSWVPWSLATTVITAVLATFATLNTVRFSLWLWAKLPVIGR